jgi:hypothetical protein
MTVTEGETWLPLRASISCPALIGLCPPLHNDINMDGFTVITYGICKFKENNIITSLIGSFEEIVIALALENRPLAKQLTINELRTALRQPVSAAIMKDLCLLVGIPVPPMVIQAIDA